MTRVQAMTDIPPSARIKHLPAASSAGRLPARLRAPTNRTRRPAFRFQTGAAADEDFDTTRCMYLFCGDPGCRIQAPCGLIAGRAHVADGFPARCTYLFMAFDFFATPPADGAEGKAETGERQ